MEGDDGMKKSVGLLMILLLVWTVLIAGCAKQATPIKSVNDLADKRIGILSCTLYDKLAGERFPAARILRFNTTADMGLALKAGQLDALIISMGPGREMAKANPEIAILTEDFFTSQIGVGFSKNNPALRERFNAYLKDVQSDGSLEAQRRKWFEQDITKVKMPQYPPQPTGQKIVAGVSAGDLPVSAYVNGEYVDYAASKGAMDTLTRGLSLEVAQQGIRVNGVRPGFIYTEMHADGGEPGRVDRLASAIPMGRGGHAEEVAEAIVWLASEAASYVTGSIIDAAGGR
jgi:NAD(P)-dependent dehydrogenase (short-subunit alcohol dehydrogenase family)